MLRPINKVVRQHHWAYMYYYTLTSYQTIVYMHYYADWMAFLHVHVHVHVLT